MPNKTARKELSSELIAVILALHKLSYSASRIKKEKGLTKGIPKLIIIFQIRRAKKHQNDPFIKAIRTGRPLKLDTHAERRLVRFIDRNPFETLTYLFTPRKSDYRIYILILLVSTPLKTNTTPFCLRRKLYLIKAYKKKRLRWA
jgi:hypothetical protein